MKPPSRFEDFIEHSQFRWLVIAGIYWPPFRFRDDAGVERLAVQELQASDAESECLLGSWLAEREPGAFTAGEVITFLKALTQRHGPPSVGVLILPSVWRSTAELWGQEVTRERVAGIYAAGLRLPEMDAGHRYDIAQHVHSAGLDLSWSEGQIENLNEVLGVD